MSQFKLHFITTLQKIFFSKDSNPSWLVPRKGLFFESWKHLVSSPSRRRVHERRLRASLPRPDSREIEDLVHQGAASVRDPDAGGGWKDAVGHGDVGAAAGPLGGDGHGG